MDILAPQHIREKLSELTDDPYLYVKGPAMLARQFPDMMEAAVLIPLSEVEGQMNVLLTRRTDTLRNHSGEISFPGGKKDDEDDDLLATALRESWEEVDLSPEDVHAFGAFVSAPTVTGFRIASYVGEFPEDYVLTHNPDEIDYLIMAPINALVEDGVHRIEFKTFGGTTYPIHFFDYGRQPIWGATAYILYEFLTFLGVLEARS